MTHEKLTSGLVGDFFFSKLREFYAALEKVPFRRHQGSTRLPANRNGSKFNQTKSTMVNKSILY